MEVYIVYEQYEEDNDLELYLKTKNGANATGEYDPVSKTFLVRKGSIVSPCICMSEKFRGAKSIIKYRELYCENNITKQEVVFKSASTAANFVTGRSTNGLIAWKNRDGKTLKSVLT